MGLGGGKMSLEEAKLVWGGEMGLGATMGLGGGQNGSGGAAGGGLTWVLVGGGPVDHP